MKFAMASWLPDIIRYFRFVNFRRMDLSAPLIPNPAKFVTATLVIVAIVFALVVYADPYIQIWINQQQYGPPKIFRFITLFGEVGWILLILGIPLIIISFFKPESSHGSEFATWHNLTLRIIFMFASIALSGLITSLLKNSIGRARPAFTPMVENWVMLPFEFEYKFASFPSGHATTGGALAMALALLFPRWRWVFMSFGVLIAISRPILGLHFISDVTAGFLFGCAFVWVYARYFAQKRLLFKFLPNGHLAPRDKDGE